MLCSWLRQCQPVRPERAELAGALARPFPPTIFQLRKLHFKMLPYRQVQMTGLLPPDQGTFLCRCTCLQSATVYRHQQSYTCYVQLVQHLNHFSNCSRQQQCSPMVILKCLSALLGASGHQVRQHPADRHGRGEGGRLWCGSSADQHHEQAEHVHWHTPLDGARGHPGEQI